MSTRLYLLPVQLVTVNGTPYRGPAYLAWRMNPDGLAVPWSMRDYGGIGETTMIVAANVTAEQHAYLAAQSGVYAIPEDLDATPSSAELNAFQAALETITIPANWLTPTDTWRSALRTILGMFATAGKYAALTGTSILASGITLNMQVRNFPAPTRAALAQVAADMGYPWADVRDNWTARTLLKWFADQWPAQSFKFGELITV